MVTAKVPGPSSTRIAASETVVVSYWRQVNRQQSDLILSSLSHSIKIMQKIRIQVTTDTSKACIIR